MSEEGVRNEIVIVRRRGGDDEEGHHGGAWKIAFADFMTAMMAFFLVMWLINSTNKKTQAEIASYFNPVKLTDRIANPRGLQELERGGKNKVEAPEASEMLDGDSKEGGKPSGKHKQGEEALFRDPFGVLSKIEAEAAIERPQGGPTATGGEKMKGEGRGEFLRDPFDPATWQANSPVEPEETPDEPASLPPVSAHDSDVSTERTDGEAPQDEHAKDVAQLDTEAHADDAPQAGAVAKVDAPAAGPATEPTAEQLAKSEADKAADKAQVLEKERVEIETKVKSALALMSAKDMPQVDVERTAEGILIRLTDATEEGMFASASAEPKAAVVKLMASVGKIIAERPGNLVVSGHTDGKPFRSQNYDNWRLSMARAQIAYYMLVRGGIDSKRVERIEGHADRKLRQPANPGAAQNRRIEILIKDQGA